MGFKQRFFLWLYALAYRHIRGVEDVRIMSCDAYRQAIQNAWDDGWNEGLEEGISDG